MANEKNKEALAIVKQMIADGQVAQDVAEKYFPELKGSEDEKIMKRIKYFINATSKGELEKYAIIKEDAIAWLEKQGEQNVLQTPTREMILAVWELGNTWKELTHGVCSTEHGTQLNYIQKHWKESDYYLEAKQGEQILANSAKTCKDEQKPADKVEPKFKYGDRVRNKKSGLEQTLGSCIEDVYEGAFPFRIKDQDDWELVEQNPDKVEPKFHEGEWITNGDYTWKIVEVKPLDYILQSQDGNIVDDTISHVDEQFHSFTIKDAKDGDVLSYVTDEENLWIMIYWSLYEPCEGCIHYHALLVNDNLTDKGTCFIRIEDLKPATKEQRDLLFQKIKKQSMNGQIKTETI